MSKDPIKRSIHRLEAISIGRTNSFRSRVQNTHAKKTEREIWDAELLDAAVDYTTAVVRGPMYKAIMNEIKVILQRKP